MTYLHLVKKPRKLDPDLTVRSVCENCGEPAEYHSTLILCPECEAEAPDGTT